MSSASNETSSGPLALVASARRGRLSLLEVIFSVRGYSVAACQNGPEVLEFLKTNVPEVAVLDHDLPGMNGREICSRARLIDRLTHLPVALVTPSLDELGGVAEFEEFAQTTRADIVVAEPLGKRNLVDHLETLIRERKATKPTTERSWSPPVMLPAPSSIAAGSSIQEAYERGEFADVEDPEFELDLLPGEVVETESTGDQLHSRASIRHTGTAAPGPSEVYRHEPYGQNGSAADHDSAYLDGRPQDDERRVPDVDAMSARIAEAMRKEEQNEQEYAGQGRCGRMDPSAEGPELGEERVGVQGQAANADLLTIGAEALEGMDGVDTVREEGTNVQALLERRDIMQALIEEQAERINSLQQRNVALRRELDKQKARDKERQDELDNLQALIQEQNETVETLQERNVSLRQDLDQHKADTSKRDSELEYLRRQSREQGETITHFQQVAEVLWQELEQRKADEGPLRDFLQRLLDRDQNADFESLRDDMQRLRRISDKS